MTTVSSFPFCVDNISGDFKADIILISNVHGVYMYYYYMKL